MTKTNHATMYFRTLGATARALLFVMLSLFGTSSYAVPAAGSSCTASALNRNAVVEADYGYTLFNIPVDQGIMKVRVTCSDGTVGQTRYEQPVVNSTTFTGDILWGTLDPIPLAITLNASTTRLNTAGQTLQLSATALDADGTTRDITPVAKGTFYTSSNPQLATISADGLITVASGPVSTALHTDAAYGAALLAKHAAIM